MLLTLNSSALQILADRTANLRLLECFSPESGEFLMAPGQFTVPPSSSDSRAGRRLQKTRSRASKGFGEASGALVPLGATGAAAAEPRIGTGRQLPRSAAGRQQQLRSARRPEQRKVTSTDHDSTGTGVSYFDAFAELIPGGLHRQEFEDMMAADGIDADDLKAFEHIIQQMADPSVVARLLMESPIPVQIAGLWVTNKYFQLKMTPKASNNLLAPVMRAVSFIARSIFGAIYTFVIVRLAPASVERPAAATDRIGREFHAWLSAEPQCSRLQGAFATIKVSGDPSRLQRCYETACSARRLASHVLAWRSQTAATRHDSIAPCVHTCWLLRDLAWPHTRLSGVLLVASSAAGLFSV